MHRRAFVTATALALTAAATPAFARPAEAGSTGATARPDETLPDTLSLPDGFQPEGIAIGTNPYAYFGSRDGGDILRVCLRTGRRFVLSEGPGTPSLGLKLDDRGRLFVAGGIGGDARVIDIANGRVLASYQLQSGLAFINDVVLTGGAAWFTDSINPVLFKLPLGRDGDLPDEAVRVPITGALTYQTGTNANGITATPDGKGLLIVQSNTGRLFRASYAGKTIKVSLNGESLLHGDGMWLRGSVLYVVQNRDNALTKLQLDNQATSANVLSRTKDARFDVPSTIAEYNGNFYLPNARFTTAATSDTGYSAVSVPIP